ncbi:Phosphopantothenate--cysteine ligase CAB2 [Sphaceloma murrayae]|uniref:Phosphopantothenate--cysteine ligase CAB2 n=1 Tax=Sphaceloma murrayae TaxID=2082308 RepID=A0A2K1R2S5_9PEZI|nr:Phosphopantothenate--cysteine ligase CAB2 [Sphaceloma murrayae]
MNVFRALPVFRVSAQVYRDNIVRSSRANCWLVTRGLHQSLACQARKPTSAILSRTNKPKKQQEKRKAAKNTDRVSDSAPSVPESKSSIIPRAASLLAGKKPSTADTPRESLPRSNDNVLTTGLATSPDESESTPASSTAVPDQNASASTVTQISRYQQRADDYWRTLSRVAEPVVLYKAPSHTQMKFLATLSMVFCVGVAKITFEPYAQYAGSNMVILAGGIAVSGFWLAIGFYLMSAPQNMIRSITAVPEKTALATPEGGPCLQMELEPVLPFMKPKMITAPAFEITRDAPIQPQVVAMIEARQREQLRFSWGKSFFRRVRSILFDTTTLFTRKSFVYVKLPGRRGNGKLDLPGIVNFDRGKALEQILAFDVSKKTGFRRLFFTNSGS